MLTLPTEWKIYSNSIRDRCQNLIELGFWGGIDINHFNAWKRNFETDEEKYFCSCVLDSLIYRSNQQTYSLINHLLNRNLNNIFRLFGLKGLGVFPQNMQDRVVDPLIRFVPVVTKDDPVTKSSFEVLRFMKRHFKINEKWMAYPTDIKKCIKNDGVKAIVFIDDFLGTGHQFDDTCKYANLDDFIKSASIFYAPLVAHEAGINYLTPLHPCLKITQTELLTKKSHSFFHNYFYENEQQAKDFYVNLMKDRNIDFTPAKTFGYGNLEINFAFEHAAPDNSLQILHKGSANWTPLFSR